MRATAFRPPGYDHGAFRVYVQLAPEEKELVRVAPPIAFCLPRLDRRTVLADRGFDVAAVNGDQVEIRGVLNADAGWWGHCYTNGVEEDANPTPIDHVVRELEGSVRTALETMSAWMNLTR